MFVAVAARAYRSQTSGCIMHRTVFPPANKAVTTNVPTPPPNRGIDPSSLHLRLDFKGGRGRRLAGRMTEPTGSVIKLLISVIGGGVTETPSGDQSLCNLLRAQEASVITIRR